MPLPEAFATLQESWVSWPSLTWFGDTALMLPAAFALGLALLLRQGSRRVALCWALAFGSVGLLVLATKIAFMGWGIGSVALDFTGLSGHSALAAVFWPAAGWMAMRRRGRLACRMAIGAGALLAVGIGFSRLEIRVHSPSEVVSGLLVGFCAAGWFLRQARNDTSEAWPFTPALLAFMAVVVVLRHGHAAPTTAFLETTVVRVLGVTRPFTRHDLHQGRLRMSRTAGFEIPAYFAGRYLDSQSISPRGVSMAQNHSISRLIG